MNQLGKIIFGSCIGVALAIVALGALGFFVMVGVASSGQDKEVKVEKNSVLHLSFDEFIPERTNNLERSPFEFSADDVLGLQRILENIDHASRDQDIAGIYLDVNGIGAGGLAKTTAIREALVKFKESGKFIIANSKSYSQGSYYLASTADKIIVHPLGGIDLHGFAATVPFFKDMLDRLGIKMQIFYAGNFKSATEPYRLNEMSDQNRLQLKEYLEPVHQRFLEEIAVSRNKTYDQVNSMVNNLTLSSADSALVYGMVDEIGYVDNAIGEMKSLLELDEEDDLETVSMSEYTHSWKPKRSKSKDRIAVIYAEGTILSNEGEQGTIVDDKYIKIIRDVRENEKVKAIVLRVNSPGGDAIASENILRELNLAQETGKKVVVSMGDYAASGGYYISCQADKIYAEPNTLTGSIGVFGMMPNMSELFEEKLGIHWDSVKTAKNAVGLNPFFELSQDEQRMLQNSTINVYNTFLDRVAEGRDMHRDSVHTYAQGRIWSGVKAKEIGLVDDLGNLDDAIEEAATMAGIEDYRISNYPKINDPMQEFLNELTGQGDDKSIEAKLMQTELGNYYPMYRHVKEMLSAKGVQVRLPILVNFN